METQPIEKIVATVAHTTAETLCYLKDRWADESAYEDFSEYAAVMKKALEPVKEAEFVKAHQRPFGFTWSFNGKKFRTSIDSRSLKIVELA